MDITFFLLIFILGTCVGSFLNVVADRITTQKSILFGRSECSYCHKTLSWYELIPLISFLILRARCRSCHKKLSWMYVGAEVLTGVLLVTTYLLFFSTPLPLLMSYFLIVLSLIGIFLVDLKKGIIPIPFLVMIILGCAILLAYSPSLFLSHILSALGAGIFFLLIFLLSKGKGMGFGDVMYSFVAGLLLGFPDIIFGLYIAFLTGAIASLILILVKKKRLHGDTVPFGPFLVLGTLVMLFLGTQITPFILSYLF